MPHRYNETKIRILAAVALLNEENIVANSKSVAFLCGMTPKNVSNNLSRLTPTYLKASVDQKRTDHCTLKYRMSKKGVERLNKMLERFENGQSLKLTSYPKPADYNEFELLPGLNNLIE